MPSSPPAARTRPGRLGWAALLALGLAGEARAQAPGEGSGVVLSNTIALREPTGSADEFAKAGLAIPAGAEPADLTFANLLDAGWDVPNLRRPTEGRAVRAPLFRTEPGFLWSELRLDYRHAANAVYGRGDRDDLAGQVVYAPDRRFQVGLFPNYAWQGDSRSGTGNRNGAVFDVGARLQLIDARNQALNVALRVETPRTSSTGSFPADLNSGEDRTRFLFTVAGFRDLGYRVGVQGHLGTEAFAGPRLDPAKPNNVGNYALALTKTLGEEVALPTEMTLFVESFGRTNLDGLRSGQTNFSVLFGTRLLVIEDTFLSTGYEVPLVGPRPFEQTVHVMVRRQF